MNEYSFKINLDGSEKIITSMAEANKEIKKLVASIVQAKEAGQDFTQELQKIGQLTQMKQGLKEIQTGLVGMNRNLQTSQTASANASMALLNLNYVIRDSPYFFQNFALGVLAVGNNLNPLIDSFSRLKKEAGEKTVSTISLLKQALVGGAGLSIAFSLVVTAIQAYVFWMAKSKDATNEFKSAVDSLLEVQNPFDKFKFALTPEQLKTLRGQLEGRLGSLEAIQGVANQNVFGAYGGLAGAIGINAPLPKALKDQLDVTKATKDEVKKQLDFMEAQTLVAEMMKGLGYDMLNTEKDITKEKEKQWKSAQSRADVENRMAGGTYVKARRSFFAGSETNERWGMRQAEQTGARGVGGNIKDLGVELEMGKIAAQELGNAIASAFEQGTIKLNQFLVSLTVAITKMLILRTVMGFLTGGIGGAASASVASPSLAKISNPNLGMNQRNTTVNVQGKIYADKNKFVADIENARDYYNNNQKLVTIGRS